ncbi:carbohydrate kinase family protein [Flavobacterium agrisoli]|uniref:Carbohydrate kinase n=1 Tax=Flavobacterium agrisoli TaxID=2793066 RepID=A0A934PM37_9FLAO|nr:carbohydrate kinase [Flavobacterium agrisoli]MBK0370707.1 carbohydrate kinase [Flavobacterium agrisoli]
MIHGTKKIKAVCFGEVLWDVFPTHKKIGGAPLNVALRLQSFGAEVSLISIVGQDVAGEELLSYLSAQGLSTALIQKTAHYPTGTVQVTLNEKGNASYEIVHPVAWDFIRFEDLSMVEKMVAEADIFVFGSLSVRDAVSRQTLLQLLQNKSVFKVFDVNLRKPHYSFEILELLMQEADFIKLNDEELLEICRHLGSSHHSFEQNIRFLSQHTQTAQLCVTKGPFGAVLYRDEQFYYNSGYFITVVDTVGAGDSFLAALLFTLFSGKTAQESLNFACAVGALVAGSEGANPVLSSERIADFMQ